jgi:hypothetical protein
MADPNTGMKKQEMTNLLKKSKKEPVNCAFAQGAEANVALLLLDKIKGSKSIEKDLVKQFPDAKNARWGSAFVDMDDDPKLVKFRVNNRAPGAAKRLVKTLKKTGFTKVVILLEDGTEVESYGEDDEDSVAAAEPAEAAAPSAPAEDDSVPPPPPPPSMDVAILKPTLAALIGRIALVADPVRKALLAQVAAAANARYKANDFAGTEDAIAKLRAALDAPAPGKPAPAAIKVTYAKSRLAWLAARQKVQSQIETLRGQINTAFAEDETFAGIDGAYTQFVSPVLAALDERLADKLDEATNAVDPTQRAKLVEEARAIMREYEAYVAGAPVISALDSNPLMPLAIRQTLSVTLTTLAKVVN